MEFGVPLPLHSKRGIDQSDAARTHLFTKSNTQNKKRSVTNFAKPTRAPTQMTIQTNRKANLLFKGVEAPWTERNPNIPAVSVYAI